MDPIIVILWIGVAVFGVTSLIALLNLAGFIRTQHGKLLIGTLITQVVVASVAAFTYQIEMFSKSGMRLPVSNFMVVEQASERTVYDGTTPIYVRSSDVSRANNRADFQFDLRGDFTSADNRVQLSRNVGKSVTVGDRKYWVVFAQMGELDANPNEPQAQPTRDFVFLSIARQND